MRSHPVVVLGAGPAGCAAAVQCARLGVPPLLLDTAGVPGGLVANAFMVENYPGLEGPVPGDVFAGRLRDHLDRFGVNVTREHATGLRSGDGAWILETGVGEVRASSLILAIGTFPRPIQVPGASDLEPRRLFYEVRHLLADIPRPERALVVGGGEAAFDYALSLARAGAEVSILVRADRETVRGRLTELVGGEPSILIERGARLNGLARGESGVLALLETRNGQTAREVDAVLAAVGRRSALANLAGDIVAKAPVPLNPAPGLFVCGDARLGAVGQAGIAVGDGLLAAAMAVEHAVDAMEIPC